MSIYTYLYTYTNSSKAINTALKYFPSSLLHQDGLKMFSLELNLSYTQPQTKVFLLRMFEISFSWFLDI